MSQSSNKEFAMAVGTSSMLEPNMMEGENFYTPMETSTQPEPEPEPEQATQNNWSNVKNDTGQLCRACANTSDYLIPIFEGEGLEHQLETKITKHLPIQVTATDTLPLQLCYQCASTLIAWDTMINSCIEADKKLRAMQEAAGEEIKDTDDFDSSHIDNDTIDSDDEPLITSKAKLAEKKKVPIKKKILSKAKSKNLTVKNDKTASDSKEGEEKERSALLAILAGIKQENDDFEDDKQVSDSADLGDIFESGAEKLFRCNVCFRSYAKITSYEAHLKIHNTFEGEIDMTCHVCGGNFADLEEVKIHAAEHLKSKRKENPVGVKRVRKSETCEWVCGVCAKRFNYYSVYLDHVLMHRLKKELEKTHACPECGLRLENEEKLREHERVHVSVKTENSEAETYVLALSNDGDDVPQDDYAVIEIPEGDEMSEFVCGECGVECSDMEAVKVHMEAHLNEQVYECSTCDEVFPAKYELERHVRASHEGNLAYVCSICSTAFASKNGLRNHRSVHLPLRYPCDECGNVFKGRSGLYLHKQRVHRGRKDFACEYCSKTFALKCQRDNHQRVHTGEKPFKCETCGAGFKAQSGLYAHRRTHTDERPYECEICGKRLRLPYNLRLHMRTHTGEKPYLCDVCGRAFSQPGDCKKHKKTHRKNVVEEKATVQVIDTIKTDPKSNQVRITYLPFGS